MSAAPDGRAALSASTRSCACVSPTGLGDERAGAGHRHRADLGYETNRDQLSGFGVEVGVNGDLPSGVDFMLTKPVTLDRLRGALGQLT